MAGMVEESRRPSKSAAKADFEGLWQKVLLSVCVCSKYMNICVDELTILFKRKSDELFSLLLMLK